jgi:hypothetical protein
MLPLDMYEYVHQQPMLPLDGSVLKQPALPWRVFSSAACHPDQCYFISPNLFSPKLRGKKQ